MSEISKNDVRVSDEMLLEEYRAAARKGRLLVRRCPACGEAFVYPRRHCPHCSHQETEWIEATGKGRLYTFTTAPGLPGGAYPAMVKLAEGPMLTAPVIEADFASLAIGDEVELSFMEAKGGEAPHVAFTPRASLDAKAYAARVIRAAETSLADASHAQGLKTVAVIGAGTMGQGISSACLIAGLNVILVDLDRDALGRAAERIAENVEGAVERGKAHADAPARLKGMVCSTDMAAIAPAGIVIEAVYENMAVKKQVMAEIDRRAAADAVLGTNTSTLDIDEIASVTRRPAAVVGLHFFSPAHIMKLLEIVRGRQTGARALALSNALGQRLGKTSVTVGNAPGFVGNRLMIARERQAARLLLDGAQPKDVDAVLTGFGLPMGTFTLQDMAGGIELNYRLRQGSGEKDWLIDRLFEAGRTGLKAGRGYYRYDAGSRKPMPDPEVAALLEEWSAAEGVERRRISPQEMQDRLILPMINEGFKLLEEGVAARPEDIDTVWLRGFGWPTWRGGPMRYAEQVGLDVVLGKLSALHDRLGAAFRPADLLKAKAGEGLGLIGGRPLRERLD